MIELLPFFESADYFAILSTADGKTKFCDGVWQLRHSIEGAKELSQLAPVGTMGGHFRTHGFAECVYVHEIPQAFSPVAKNALRKHFRALLYMHFNLFSKNN